MSSSPPPSGRSPLMLFLRYWLPGLICAVGMIWGVARGFDELGLEIAVLLVAAGSSLWLMNILMRVGIAGDSDRDDEDAARAYFDKHGRWPDEEPPS
ncbi:MAG: hypothetical protein JWM73_985 [Solirubrobacterales bacterium]|nr:hypothetical protein [Solirubrobacterales bacterium]